jgi:hypothetical protein
MSVHVWAMMQKQCCMHVWGLIQEFKGLYVLSFVERAVAPGAAPATSNVVRGFWLTQTAQIAVLGSTSTRLRNFVQHSTG